MPVRFEQPSPLAPGITAGAGAAQQYSRDLPSLVSLYSALIGRGGGGGHGGGGGGAPNIPMHRGGFGDVAGAGGRNIGGGGGMGGGGYPMSQAERIRMAQLQAADSWVDSQDDLSDAEKFQYKQQIHAGLDPLLVKQQQEKLKQMQEQTQQVHQQAALMEGIRQGNLEAGAKGIQTALPTVMGADGKRHSLYFDGKTWKILESKNAATEEQNKLKEWRADQAQAHKELGPEASRDAINERAREIAADRADMLAPPGPDNEAPTPSGGEAMGGGEQRVGHRVYRGGQVAGGGATGGESLGTAPAAGQSAPLPSIDEAAARIWKGNFPKEEAAPAPQEEEEE